jgi:tryptophan-rich sensory protein
MTVARVAAVGLSLLLVVVYAVGSGRWVTTSSEWYLGLQQPWWQPPPAVFGIAWSYNFVALAVVGVAMSVGASPAPLVTFLLAFAVSISFALAWAYLFYVPHDLTWAAVFLSACAAVTVVMVVAAFADRWWLALLLLPYQAWLAIAASLAWGYLRMN